MRALLVAAGVAGLAAVTPAGAQPLATRVTQAPDGVVRMQVDSRPGVCGDGDEMIAYRDALFGRNFQSIGGHWTNRRCVSGPLLIALTVADGAVRQLRTRVGGGWPGTGARVTDLGSVPAPEASAYFFSLVPRLERTGLKDRVLLPAVLADAGPVTQPLLALVRDSARSESTRRSAVLWLALLGEPGVFGQLRALYATVDDDVRDAILHAMSLDDVDGGSWLIARTLDERESIRVRKNAFFWAGQREATPTAELVRVHRRLDGELREHGIFVLSQRRDDAAVEELIRIAREDRDTGMRGKALFWLAQNDDPRVRKLIADLILK